MGQQRQRVLRLYAWVILPGFVVLGIVILGRILWIQYVEGAELRSRAEDIAFREATLEASRGNIVADDGRLLLTSIPEYSIHMDMWPNPEANSTDSIRFFTQVDSLASCLSGLFGDASPATYRARLLRARRAKHRHFRLGNRNLRYPELQELMTFPLLRLHPNQGGRKVTTRIRRLRPLDELALRTVGYLRQDAAVGLEASFDFALRGQAGRQRQKRSYQGHYVPVAAADNIPPVDGDDVVTTIDINLQDVVERALRSQLIHDRAQHGTAVVMEVKTGDIKAIANLTRNAKGDYHEVFNYAVGESTDPGSTFKLATIIALLEDGHIRLDDTIDTGPGEWTYLGKKFKDTRPGGYGRITIREAFEVSSNIAMAKLVTRYYPRRTGHDGARDFVDRLYSMRLNERLGVPIAGEKTPVIKYPRERYDSVWSGITLPMMSTGYEVQLTPLQILTLYNAIANNGRMVQPRFVTALERNGRLVQRFPVVEILPKICTDRTLVQVRELLAGVVERGTARNIHLDDYSIAGKTGTAQIPDSSGYLQEHSKRYRASFVGYFPADKPHYSCIVVVTDPKHSYYGSSVAAPIFSQIVNKIRGTRSEWFPTLATSEKMAGQQCKDGLSEPLLATFSELKLPVNDRSQRRPWSRTKSNDGGITLSPAKGLGVPGIVPDVIGLPLNDALYALENAGLVVSRVRGRGTVQKQSLTPGSHLEHGERIELSMSIL